MVFSPDFDVKDQVKQATDLVDLIGSEMNLRRKGVMYVGVCPWHDDNKPSFQVNPNKQTWVCYPCDVRGDAFDYVMKREGVDFRQALEILAERAGIELKQIQKSIVKGSANDKATLYRAMKWCEDEYHQLLLNRESAAPIRQYLDDRGITSESIDAFRIGFCPLSWTWLVDRAQKTPYSPQVLEACGMISQNKSGGWYDRFRGRLMFPIRDTQERPIAFGGRVVPGIYEGETPPAKYYNSSETRLFSKSKNLYALNMARNEIQKTTVTDKRLTIVEGYTDVVAAWQSGLKNVVAALGVALNEQHIQLIKRFADGITLVLDGDDAGQRTMNTALDLFVAHDIDLRILSLPQGLDPFDYLMEHGGAEFQKMVDEAPDAIAHKILTETRGLDLVNDTHRANLALENILMTLAKVPARLIAESAEKSMRQAQIVMRLARQFQIAPEQVRARLTEQRASFRPRMADQPEQNTDRIDYASFDRSEAEIIQLLIQDPSLLDKAVENVAPTQFKEGVLRELYEVMGESFHDGKDVGYQQLMLDLENPKLKSLVDYLYDEAIKKKEAVDSSNSVFAMDLGQQLDAIITAFNDRLAESGNQAKISQLHGRELDEKEETSALEELFQLQLQKMKKTK